MHCCDIWSWWFWLTVLVWERTIKGSCIWKNRLLFYVFILSVFTFTKIPLPLFLSRFWTKLNDCVILTPSFFILRVDLGIKMSQREYHRMSERIAHSNSWLGILRLNPFEIFQKQVSAPFPDPSLSSSFCQMFVTMDEARNREVLLAILMCVTGRSKGSSRGPLLRKWT